MDIDKNQILQEARQFFGASSVKTKRLVGILTKCILILYQGEKLTPAEATDLFFHITRLFQYKDKDSILRRLTYIGIKALAQQAENVYVVTSSLMTDVNPSKDDPAIRASALRALCQISDVFAHTSLQQYLSQSLVDKQPVVASAAISSLVQIASVKMNVVDKCTKDILEALNSDSPMVQYHALGLRYISCKNDKLAASRLITVCIRDGLKSPIASCLLIRIITTYINEYEDEDSCNYLDFIKQCLTDKSEMVEYEAANALVNLKPDSTESKARSDAIAHLRNFLSSSKPSLRFAAVRSLNELNRIPSNDYRFWSIHRIGPLCKLHLLNKRYRMGDHIIGIMDFSDSNVLCAKYNVIWQCEEVQRCELVREFSYGLRKNDFMLTIPQIETSATVLHCVLSFIFHIVDKNIKKTSFEDKAGVVELGPSELATKPFGCDFPIAVYT